MTLVAAGYCLLVAYRLIRYRRQFASILSSSQSKINKSRFIRLFALATVLVLVFLPVVLYTFIRNLQFPHHPYSWRRVHAAGWSQRMVFVPAQGVVNFDRWTGVGSAYAIFVFFGFGRDATMMYRGWLMKLGFGRIYPALNHPHLAEKPSHSGPQEQNFVLRRLGSVSSRARLIFQRKTSNTHHLSSL